MIARIAVVAVAMFPLSEIVLGFVKRSGSQTVQHADRGSMRLVWLSILLGMVLALLAQWAPWAHLPGSRRTIDIVGLAVMACGLALRWVAILMLGRFFTVDVAIQTGHVVYQGGPYRFIRHPSYTGLLVAFLGVGVLFANWLSILLLLLPIVLAMMNRVVKEERVLLGALGDEYTAYCARTQRFIPGVF